MSVSIFKHHLPCRSSRGDVCGEECANKVHPPLEKWSSEHLKNNRILSKGEKKLPRKCSQCGDCEELCLVLNLYATQVTQFFVFIFVLPLIYVLFISLMLFKHVLNLKLFVYT